MIKLKAENIRLSRLLYNEMYGEYQLILDMLPNEFLRQTDILTVRYQNELWSFELGDDFYIPLKIPEYKGDVKLIKSLIQNQTKLFKVKQAYDEE